MNVCRRSISSAVAHQAMRAGWHGGLAVLLLLAPLAQAESSLDRARERSQDNNAALNDDDTAVPQRTPSMPGVSMATRIDFTLEQERTMPVAQRIAIEQATNDTALISLNYKNGDLQNILRLIARVSGVNLVAGPDVRGTVTIELHDVYWEQALNLVLSANGYTYVRDGNILRVVSADQVEKEPLAIVIIPINYAKAAELLPVLTPLLTASRGKIESDERVNALIITDIPAKLGQLEKVVQRLDQPTPQVLIEAKFIEIAVGDVDSEGVDWSNLGDYGVVLHDMLYTFDRQVEMARSGANEGDFHEFPIPSGLPANKARTYAINQTQATTYQLEPDQFRLAFSMLLNNSRAKLISNPKIQTLDNKRATIRVAETRYKPKFTFNKETGSYEINDLEDIYVGITLEVTPHVNYNGDVTLDIIPEVSDLTGNQIIQGVEVPITNIRRIETRVSLRDRYTVAVGGIVKDNWVTTKRSVPYLCDMPYLGPYLFTWETKELRTVNLVIFLTPTILRTANTDPRWQPQLEQMHVDRVGEWHDVITNTPSLALLRMREQLLITAATNQIGGFEVKTKPRTP